jgi:putative transposase
VTPVGPLAPNLNAHAERFVQTIRQECLGHFVFFGEMHLRHVIGEFVKHYHQERPHHGVGNVPLSEAGPVEPWHGEEILRSERLGGLLKGYRKAG